MMKSAFIFLFFVLIQSFQCFSQSEDSLKLKIEALKKVGDFIEEKHEQYYNSAIAFDFDQDSLIRVQTTLLISILKDSRSNTPEIQNELSKCIIQPVISDDNKIRIYSFPVIRGRATGHYYYNVIQYLTKDGKPGAYLLKRKDCGYNDRFKSIYKIKGKDLYIAITITVWCSTCNNEKAIVFQLNSNYLITDYPAFSTNTACLSIDTRAAYITNFYATDPVYGIDIVTYNKDTQELTVRYYTHYDLNYPMESEEERDSKEKKLDDLAIKNPFYDYPKDKNGLIKVVLKFNGTQFEIK